MRENLKELWIAPKLERDTHQPTGENWFAGDYPGHWIEDDKWEEEHWNIAVNIFEDRIYGRFINYINLIEGYEQKNRDYHAGFVILALDCLLIETLQQFYDGRDSSKGSEKAFEGFLTTSTFKQDFGTDTSDGSLADLFYDQIRCGILHQAEVKTDSRVVAYGKMITEEKNGISVNRSLFHKQLEKELGNYIVKLRNPQSKKDRLLREKFRIKMGFICRVT